MVIVGAGFGGLAAASALGGSPVEVTLVDRENFHTFTPLLYQVATSGLAPDDIAPNVRGIVQRHANVEARMATVEGVDLEARHVLLDRGPSIPYDHLVLAAGTVSSDFGIPGVARHAWPLKTLDDAVRLRSTVLRRFEEAHADPSRVDDGTLSFVVAGGGPTGVELCGALAELFDNVLAKDFKRLDVSRARVVLVEMSDHLLGPFSSASRHEARVQLELRGVEVRTGARITSVSADGVTLDNGSTIAARTVVWATGVKANPLGASLGLPTTHRGELEVGSDLTVGGRPEISVIGDLAAAGPRAGEAYPQLAPVAIQGGRYTARRILDVESGRASRPFRYVDKGIMATIGRRSAVAELPFGIRIGGTLGWLSWLGLHLVSLIGFRNRAVVLVDWSWNYMTWDRGNRVILEPAGDR